MAVLDWQGRRRAPPAGCAGGFAMKIKTYFAIFAVLSILFGIGFVLAPGRVLSNYGVENSPAVALMSRLFGGTLLAMAVILWSARDFHDGVALRAVLIGTCIADTVNLVVALLRPLPVRSMRWVGPRF
jgi:hypothetical protein